MITNNKLVKLYRNQQSVRDSYENLCKRLEAVHKKRNELEDTLSLINRVSEIYEGVPLYVERYDFGNDRRAYVSTVINERRAGSVYRNQHRPNDEFWLAILEGTKNRSGERLLKNHFDNMEEPLLIVKQWVAFGKLPKD